jgi:hypothetical protein
MLLGVMLTLAIPLALGVRPATAAAPSPPRTIAFSGYTWSVKSSAGKTGPGPNYFSNSANNVWVDGAGQLHMKITRVKGRWYSAEIINQASLGQGTYTWELASPVDNLDPYVVLGLFTWNDNPAYNHREIDIEFARWGNALDPTNGQFTVQPWDTAGNLLRITQAPNVTVSTQSFTWGVDSVAFASSGATPPTWSYTGADVPVPGGENARINLWLYNGHAPADGRVVEIVIKSFTFTAAP